MELIIIGILNVLCTLLARYAQSFDSAKANHNFSSSRFYINLEDRDYQKWFYKFTFSSSGNEFNPRIGFVDRTNFNQAYDKIGYGVFPSHSKLQYKLFSFSAGSYFNKQTGKVESLNIGPNADILWNYCKIACVFLRVFSSLYKLKNTL